MKAGTIGSPSTDPFAPEFADEPAAAVVLGEPDATVVVVEVDVVEVDVVELVVVVAFGSTIVTSSCAAMA